MLITDFSFDLPERLVAQEPVERGASRLLALGPGDLCLDHRIRDLPELLVPGDLVVVNNTRVLAARLFGRKESGAAVEILLAEKVSERDWICLVKPGRRARPGSEIVFSDTLRARVVEKSRDGRHRLHFSAPPERALDELGHVPLPPYIKRPDRRTDRERYQTVYATVSGAIAAPTAGLHFDRPLLAELERRQIGVAELTLHVGLGTFKPVTATLVHEHTMDAERYDVPESCAAAIAATRERNGRVVAVGTTVVRTLETVASRSDGRIEPGTGSTNLFIVPGFEFRVVDLLLTNFHLPRSTLLMLVCAFGGTERILAAYRQAVDRGYRFYSYGDAMLVTPERR